MFNKFFTKEKRSKIREILQGVSYHTYSRLINCEPLMRAKKMKYLMEHVLNKALKKYNFELNNYALLDNHFHFIITTIEGEATISEIMQFIKAQFAQRYNKMVNRTGPVWNERFGHRIIENADDPKFYYNYLCMYIFYNPVRKGYVRNPREYEFSGIRFYLEEDYTPRVQLTLSKYFLRLGENFKERIKKFLEFEKLYIYIQTNKDFVFFWIINVEFQS